MATPLDNLTSLTLRVTVKVDGSPMGDTYGLSSANIVHTINKISVAEVVLLGNFKPAEGTVPVSDAADFNPGKEIEITAGYGNAAEKSLFKGFIVKHSLEVDGESPFKVRLTCKHKAVSMTFNEKEASFKEKKDSDIITAVIGTYSGLSSTVTATTNTYENFFQVRSTDWDFILSRADFNGYIICMDGADYKLEVGKPKLDGAAVMKIAVGESMMAFEAELNAEDQPTALNASGWDNKTQAMLKSAAAEPTVNAQGETSLSPKSLSGKLNQTALDLVSPTPMTTAELKVWADAVLLRKRMAALKGRVKYVGNATVKTGNIIELEGVGKKFNGKAFVSSVNHIIEPGTWNTTVRFGLDNTPIHKLPDFGYSPATGQLPPVYGLQIATVKKLSEDPGGQYRIQVELASVAETKPQLWARYVNFYATSTAGAGFLPEINDEVIVGFLDNDPRYPVIIGSVYSPKNKPANPPADENNYIKSIITKAKLKITFDDEKKVMKFETPGANSITISDEDKSILIKDQNGNSVKMSSAGIDLDSAKDINLKSKGAISIKATTKVAIEASGGDVELKGLNIKNTAQVGFTAKGTATAELSASGQTTVKGAMVMIN
ncbi:MAG TPA: Rhs element Vgr protein [Chitinophagaceae bacterium]|nr:Rhs element Vgr protein [Chitinophagaceae bacterium]